MVIMIVIIIVIMVISNICTVCHSGNPARIIRNPVKLIAHSGYRITATRYRLVGRHKLRGYDENGLTGQQ